MLFGNKKDNNKFTAIEKFAIGCKAVAGIPVTEIAEETSMSRQHIYNQKVKVLKYAESLNKESENGKVFELTEAMRRRTILSLTLSCHATLEGIQQFFCDIYGTNISIGYISGVLSEATKRAQTFDDSVSLENIKQGANDEIFQGNTPILTGIDPETTYTYLLEEAGDRTADTWELFMHDRKDHGLNLEVSISDAGAGIISGIPRVYPEIQIQPDIFHAIRPIGIEISKTERQAYAQITKEIELTERSKGKRPQQKTIEQLAQIRPKVQESIRVYDVLFILFGWLRELLGFSGYSKEDTLNLIRYVLSEMAVVSQVRPAFLKEIEKFGKNLPELLSFIDRLFHEMEVSAEEHGIPPDAFRLMYSQLSYNTESSVFQEIEYQLILLLTRDYDQTREEFSRIFGNVKKASSLVENLNGRIRPYMNIKRTVPTGFFVLMKVYFNTHRYRRSRCKERVGKSPLELLRNEPQPNFFEALGY